MEKIVIKKMNGDIIFSYISKNNSMCKTILKYIEVCKKGGKIADFSYANFRGADFREVDFSHADFSNADFYNTDFSHADFSHADFSNANFIGANFTDTDFNHADFRGADFREIDLRDTNFSNTINFLINCPEEGSFIAYKKASTDVGIPVIVVIRVEEDSLRSSATSKKCRASKVTPLRFEDLKGNILPEDTIVFSDYDNSFIYHIGKTIEVENFDLNRWNECSTGIHFFMNKLDAIHY